MCCLKRTGGIDSPICPAAITNCGFGQLGTMRSSHRVKLSETQAASFDWALQKGTVRWRDLSLYQGEKLIPNIRGKEMVFGPLANFRDAPCQICHGFQTRMASVSRDAEEQKIAWNTCDPGCIFSSAAWSTTNKPIE